MIIRMRIWITILALALCGCTPVLQQKVKQERADEARYDAEAHARDRVNQCSQAALPGTLEHMNCVLGRPSDPSPKPP